MYIYIDLMYGSVTRVIAGMTEALQSFTTMRTSERNLALTNLKVGIHVRYADDILVLCRIMRTL